MSSWLEIAVMAAPSYVDELAGLLASEVPLAQAGLVVRDREVAFWIEPAQRDNATAQVKALLAALAERGAPIADSAIEVRDTPPEKEWREAYKRYFKVARLTRQIVVVPSWESFEPGPDDHVLAMDPGQAFGTGSHATTTLVLRELQRLADSGLRVSRALDAGTGSGILSIAISRLSLANAIDAYDCDPLAVSAATENCERNQVVASIAKAELPPPGQRYGLIVANIQRHVLLAIADELTTAAEPGATLVLSGLLEHQVDEVADVYIARGWSEHRREIDADDSDWGVLTLVRP